MGRAAHPEGAHGEGGPSEVGPRVLVCMDGDYIIEKTIGVDSTIQAFQSLMGQLLATQERLTAGKLECSLFYTDTRMPPELRSSLQKYAFETFPLKLKPGNFARADSRPGAEVERVTVEVASGLESNISRILMEAVVDKSATAIVFVARAEEFA
jgi:hypothetical protein